ncbi:hypothetical protein [uncultured Ruminococcus sp.]|uniref:hypothetical protein n=1 Tax=uncultured Ruminococcus sp. TaxID=165186 RepID=UPI000ECAC237|nr:hypothetical protein [uncultured Ruminococcus sp.]HCJ40782.1 hypothetical protein [Ruminococcus sp.]
MKENYNHDFASKEDGQVMGCLGTMVFFGVPLMIAVLTYDTMIGMLFSILVFAIMLVILYTCKASFSADERAVTFRYLLKKTVIPYEIIKSIEVNAELREMRGRGGVNRHYAEVISFHCDGEKEYVFGGNLDIDFEAILKDPNYLQKQTENSAFSRLKAFIEDKMA